MSDRTYIELVFKVLKNWYLKFATFTPRLFAGIFLFLLIYLASRFLSKLSLKIFQKFFPTSRNRDMVVGLINLFRFLIILSGSFLALEIMGLSSFLLKFLGSLGVAGIIAGVALKDLVSSIFSGMLIGIDKSFKPGDYITIQGISGTVEEIGFLTTKIINEEGKKVYVPNQLIFNAPFINITASARRKIIIDLTVSSNQEVELIKSILYNSVKKLEAADEKEEPDILLMSQNQNNLAFKIKFWTKNPQHVSHIRSQAITHLKKDLDEMGIENATMT